MAEFTWSPKALSGLAALALALALAGACGSDGAGWQPADAGGAGPPAAPIGHLCADAGGEGACAPIYGAGGYADLNRVCLETSMWTCSEWAGSKISSVKLDAAAFASVRGWRVSFHEYKDFGGKTVVIDVTAPGAADLAPRSFNDRARSVRVQPL